MESGLLSLKIPHKEKRRIMNKKSLLSVLTLLLVSALIASCAPAAGSSAKPVTSVPADLVAACKAEGTVTIIATPGSWADYQEIFDLFTATTGAKINSLDENAGSADELKAIEANKGNTGPQAPDIVDVGYAYGQQGTDAGDYQAYKVSTWDKIPDTVLGLPAKESTGLWTAG